jgi:Fe2+ transport system protein FeoA
VVLTFLAVVISTFLESLRLPLWSLTSLTISEAGVAVKYNVYLSYKIETEFQPTDRSRVEVAAILLRHAGVNAEVRKLEVGGRDVWYVYATTNKLAAGRNEVRDALAEFVREVIARGWVDASKAEGWLKKLEKGLTLEEGWPMYSIQPTRGGLMVRFSSTNLDSIKQVARRLREMGLEEGVHFSVKMPEGGKAGHIWILKEGLAYAAWLSVHGSERQRGLAAAFVKYILQRAEEAGKEVCEKAQKIIEEGMSGDP